MKKISPAFIVSIFMVLLFGCSGWNQASIEKKYGPPAKKETMDDKTIYSYYFSGRTQMCVDFSFDKEGKLIEKKGYYDEWCAQMDPWLNTVAGGEPSEIDVTGRWYDIQGSGLFTWGEAHVRQEQGKVRGAIGDYNIIGVVSGKTVYLVFQSGGLAYYRARLEMVQDLLAGNYFYASDKKQTKGYPMALAKTVEPSIK
jgi:hypothetical protein